MICTRDRSRGAQAGPSSVSSSSASGPSTRSDRWRQRWSWDGRDDKQRPQQHVGGSDCGSGHSEEMLFWGGGLERVDSDDTLVELPSRADTGMTSDTAAGKNVVERRRSYGIGGAGNMRFPSQEKAAEQGAAVSENDGTRRRRSSTWSMQSAGSLVDRLFRRGSKSAHSSGSGSSPS